ncbi:hypothetical protein H5410_004036 [Solanum commersonii]|uniref:Uncharacterized protein n=1 Tax=Solanum commersonii TaxID=4109 RepID=A0A9J6B7B6_SOLCO|nr:hypothetical protein H5410_004036 [Solanum commersonii]
MTSKSQHNKDGGQEREQEVRRDTSKKCDKSRARNSFFNPLVVAESLGKKEKFPTLANSIRRLSELRLNNFSSLETVALEGLDEVKSNLVELEEVNKEGLTNLELELTEALSSLHRVFETDNRSQNVPPKVDNNRNKSKPIPNRGSDERGNNRNQPFNIHKNYEDRKKDVPHREICYICGDTIHNARYYSSLSKLNAMVAAQKQ